MMQKMDLESSPLGDVTDSPVPERQRTSSRPSSQGTVFRVSAGNTPTTRRISNVPKQPLGVDLTFGNSPSTIRHFKRVSSGERRAALRSNPADNLKKFPNHGFHPNPEARTFRPSPLMSSQPADVNNENIAPEQVHPPMPVTKDALYGRRAYGKILDSVFQEAQANTALAHQREAIGRVGQAWQHLDEVDPQGEFMLLKAMVDRLKNDTKLASALGIEVSPAKSPLKHNTKSSDTSLGGTTVHGTGTTRIRSSTSTSSISSTSKSSEYDREATSTIFRTPSSTPLSAVSGTPLKGAKLVLAQNDSHLKSHRRRQSAFVTGEKMYNGYTPSIIDEKKLPGHVDPGMEQQGLLADILYGQWMQGLRTRWPIV